MIFHFKNNQPVFCDKHQEDVDAKDTLPFINLLIAETIDDKLFRQFCGYSEETHTPAKIAKIPQVLEECFPLCCFLRDPIVNRIKSDLKAKKTAPPKPKSRVRCHMLPHNERAKQSLEQMGWHFVIGLENQHSAELFALGYHTSRTDHETCISVIMADDPKNTRYEIWFRPKQGQ